MDVEEPILTSTINTHFHPPLLHIENKFLNSYLSYLSHPDKIPKRHFAFVSPPPTNSQTCPAFVIFPKFSVSSGPCNHLLTGPLAFSFSLLHPSALPPKLFSQSTGELWLVNCSKTPSNSPVFRKPSSTSQRSYCERLMTKQKISGWKIQLRIVSTNNAINHIVLKFYKFYYFPF